MQPGIYKDIPNDDYHSGEGISKSGLDLINKSPAHYKAAMDGLVKREPTAAQALGTAFHTLILEPHIFWEQYAEPLKREDHPQGLVAADLVNMINELNTLRLPKLPVSGSKGDLIMAIIENKLPHNFGSKDNLKDESAASLKQVIATANQSRQGLLKATGTTEELAKTLRDNGVTFTLWQEIKDEYAAKNEGREILSEDAFYQLINMRDAVFAHPSANKLLTGVPGKAELSVYWHDPDTGVLCRCRPDFWREDGYLVDLKTTTDASVEGFAKSIANFRYHVQSAFYKDGVMHAAQQSGTEIAPIKGFAFLAVEKDACVVNGVSKGVGVYILDEESLMEGEVQYRKNLDTFAGCETSGHWPGYSNKVEKLTLPRWAIKSEVEA